MLINPSLQHQSEILAFPWGSDSLSKLDAELYIHRTCELLPPVDTLSGTGLSVPVWVCFCVTR